MVEADADTDYASLDVFDKELNGFAYDLNSCETVSIAGPTTAAIAAGNGCQTGEYLITPATNAGAGYARGVEAAFETFFDFLHHVHHLSSEIPYYRLPEVLRDHPDLAPVGRVTMMDSLRAVKLVLSDEARGRLVSFRDLRR